MLPSAAVSLDEAHAAIELWEHYSGKTLDPTQRLSVEVMMAQDAAGNWAASTTGREMARQGGKGDEIEVVELWGLIQRGEAILHTVHDAVLLATQTQQRMLAVLDHRDLRPKIKKKWQGTGQQMIEMRNGGIIWYRTRTGAGGRGVDDVARLVVDEAQHATDEHMASTTPTLLANANPQLNAAGSAGLPGISEWWWRLRMRALSDDPGSFGYVGHTAEKVSVGDDGAPVQSPVDVFDRRLWRMANPAVANGRGGGMAFLEEQLVRLGEERFAQEHLCVWAPPGGAKSRSVKLPTDAWASTVTVDIPSMVAGEVTLAFDVSIDGASASVAVGHGSISSPYVEMVDHRDGVGWLPARIVELVERWSPVALGCNGAGPAGAQVGPIIAALRVAGLTIEVDQLSSRRYKAACGGLYADVVEGRLRRPAGQGPLELAAADATERPLGDAWAWDMRQSTVPVSPLVAVTIARALLTEEAPVAPSVPGVLGTGDNAKESALVAAIAEEERRALETLNGR